MIVPDAIVRHVLAGPPSQANVACTRLTSAGDKPVIVIIANDVAIVDFTNAFRKAIDAAKAAGDDDAARAWRELVLRILAAYDGLGQLPE